MAKNKNASRAIFLRYILKHLLIFLIPFTIAMIFYFVSASSIEKAADAIASVQLRESITFIDRKLQNIEKQSDWFIYDYTINRALNTSRALTGIEQYNLKHIAARLSDMVFSSQFLSCCFIFMNQSNAVIADSGYSPYDLFYGPIFEIEGITADQWKGIMDYEDSASYSFMPGYRTSMGGKFSGSHILLRKIGKNRLQRGAFVAVINAGEMGRLLAKLPEQYRGVLLCLDKAGNTIAASGSGIDPALLTEEAFPENKRKIRIDGTDYRVYQLVSRYNNWRYIALMNRNEIFAGVIRVRNQALILLLVGILFGISLSYVMAFSNTKPFKRLFSLVRNPDAGIAKRKEDIYSEVEEAILQLSDRKNQLENEFNSTLKIARTQCLQNLLNGEYTSRSNFTADRERFRIVLTPGLYFIMVCRISLLMLAVDSDKKEKTPDMLLGILSECLMSDEYALPCTGGAVALILRTDRLENYRSKGNTIISTLSEKTDVPILKQIRIGIGTVVKDPFLLPLSYGEAEAACASIAPERRLSCCFYEDIPAQLNSYTYPMHTEDAVIRAIKSGNSELLRSLLHVIETENFLNRFLSPMETSNLILALRGTALRLLADLPDNENRYSGKISGINPRNAGIDAFEEIADILLEMTDNRNKDKHSHNENLSSAIREYVSGNFNDFNLGLSVISEHFNISENYLSSFFKEQEGECLSTYIQRKRMTEASSVLVMKREIPIKKIAVNCGYPNSASFRRAFKRVFGLSPSDYRSRNS
ncbi:MAG: AraC family transcriptional regulator [Spirochaetales bacterium]|nr:AraC family transcriptional regulator [Spirochaetales bacterium]